jgi:catechol 2,3-dioxygenase
LPALDRARRVYGGGLCGHAQIAQAPQHRVSRAGSPGGYHHHIGLNTWESRGGSPAPPGTTGLFHLAILYPTRTALADALKRLRAAGVELDGASNDGVSEAPYLRDPDGNGLELCWDRPEREWPRNPDGTLAMFTRRLDLAALLREAL